MGLAESILASRDVAEAIVEVPEWGCKVLVREMSARQRMLLEDRALELGGRVSAPELFARVLSKCVLDPDTHEPVFTLSQAQELVGSEDHSGVAVQRIVNMVLTRAGLGATAEDEAMANFSSEKTPTSSSSSSGTRSASRSSRK